VSEEQQQTAMTFFRAEDAPTLDDDGMMTIGPIEIDPAAVEAVDFRLLGAGQHVTVLFKGEGPDGFSLVSARFAPGYRLPRHSHSADCLYYVVSGEAHMGSRVLKPGDGFFILAEAPYAYTAGPEGVEVLEFRHATTFDIKIRDKTVEQWKPVIEAIRAHGDTWSPAPVGAA
jgi:quercetin dioxygenase-like cupin family protein